MTVAALVWGCVLGRGAPVEGSRWAPVERAACAAARAKIVGAQRNNWGDWKARWHSAAVTIRWRARARRSRAVGVGATGGVRAGAGGVVAAVELLLRGVRRVGGVVEP